MDNHALYHRLTRRLQQEVRDRDVRSYAFLCFAEGVSSMMGGSDADAAWAVARLRRAEDRRVAEWAREQVTREWLLSPEAWQKSLLLERSRRSRRSKWIME